LKKDELRKKRGCWLCRGGAPCQKNADPNKVCPPNKDPPLTRKKRDGTQVFQG